MNASIDAVYDFELMPYALGDVLTWNVQTAIRCGELERERVDIHICLDPRRPSNVFQWDLVNAENSPLFFNELFGAFGTHPRPGNVYIYRDHDQLLARLRQRAAQDPQNAESLADYERAVAARLDGSVLVAYFTKYIYSHARINAYARKHGGIPQLRPSMGCEADVRGLLRRFGEKRIVTFHLRLRGIDVGYGGSHTVARDSDFLEWYEFLREAGSRHPDVQFVALGRLQEKPLELLRLPNVVSLRALGLGLGHDLTLMLHSDLFMGTSSGFAAMANFSEVPYFITRMTPESCKAYEIAPGAERLPFANARQRLVYQPETRELLMRLLEQGLDEAPPKRRPPGPVPDPAVDVRSWQWESSRWLYRSATTYRFFTDDRYADKESAFLLWPRIRQAHAAWRKGSSEIALATLARIEQNFPRTCARFPEFLKLKSALAVDRGDLETVQACRMALEELARSTDPASLHRMKRALAWCYPLLLRLKYGWRRGKYLCRYFWIRRHRIPAKLAQLAQRLATR